MNILLGCIADDFTGATDLAGTLVREGMRSVQTIGVPDLPAESVDADAVVVALKSRTIAPAEAVEQSLEALKWLQSGGCERFFFKICSTFDSTDKGNIGPVAEALLGALGADFAIASPSFPRNGRTVFKGHLFVGDGLLNESGMQDHPLTPMTDANLVRVLQRQCRGEVGLIAYDTVNKGAAEIMAACRALRGAGKRFAIVDALDDDDLRAIGAASADLPLIVGGSGVAIGLPDNFRRQGRLPDFGAADALPAVQGHCAVVAGSCSRMTRQQVALAKEAWPHYRVDPLALAKGHDAAGAALAELTPRLADGPVLAYATAQPEEVRAVQDELGSEEAGGLVEDALAGIARGLVEAGVRKLIVAGGETAGAVVRELGVAGLRIGPEIDPGVPWCVTLGEPRIALALKSGNFGTPDFFIKALGRLP